MKWLAQKRSGSKSCDKSSSANQPHATVDKTVESPLDSQNLTSKQSDPPPASREVPNADDAKLLHPSPVKLQGQPDNSHVQSSLKHMPRSDPQLKGNLAQAEDDAETMSDEELDLNQCSNPMCEVPTYLAPHGLKKCTRCKKASYCGRECQSQHWKWHRNDCGKL